MDAPASVDAMTRLVDPHVCYQAGYLAASDEFAQSGEQRDGDGDLAQPAEPGYDGYEFTRAGLADADEFARFVAQRVAARDEDTPRRSGWTACHFFWVVDDEDEYVGSLALRHELTPFLLREGGHIGYSIRPSARRAATPAKPCGWPCRWPARHSGSSACW